jgi:hypothetical protein
MKQLREILRPLLLGMAFGAGIAGWLWCFTEPIKACASFLAVQAFIYLRTECREPYGPLTTGGRG